MTQFIGKKPRKDDPYTQIIISFLDNYGEGLALLEDLNLILNLPEEQSHEIVSFFLELACQSQGASNINHGRYCLQNLPREWLKQRIEDLAEPLLSLNDEWEYRRLLELYYSIDESLTLKLAKKAILHGDPTIREAGEDFLK